MKLLLPREHGAWGILLIPFLTTAAIARRGDAPVVLCLAAIFLAYLARHPLELLLAPQIKRFYRGAARGSSQHGAGEPEAQAGVLSNRALLGWFSLYAALGSLAALPLFLVFHRKGLLVLAGVAGGFFLLRVLMLRTRAERSLLGEWLAAPGLALTAPAAWVAATGSLNGTALLFWLLHTLFFSSGIFYVKFRIRVLAEKRSLGSLWERVVFAREVIIYHVLMVLFAATVVHIGWASALPVAPRGPEHWASWVAALPFLPAAGRALAGVIWLDGRLQIKRLGWSEVAHSLIFAALLILSFGLRE